MLPTVRLPFYSVTQLYDVAMILLLLVLSLLLRLNFYGAGVVAGDVTNMFDNSLQLLV